MMSEIKSTLDLVMEKTKHLSLSRNEKQEQSRRELTQKAKGLVSKVMDGKITTDHLRTEVQRLHDTHPENNDRIFIQVICNALELEQDNTSLISLLNDLFDLNTQNLTSLFADHQEAVQNISQKRSVQTKQNLLQHHSISGSSVTPNLKKDPVAIEEMRKIKDRFDRKLRSECDRVNFPNPKYKKSKSVSDH